MTAELNALSAPFPLSAVDFKPQVMNKEKTSGMAATYVDARAVAERLDSVIPFGWSASYRTIHSEADRFVVECAITLTLADGRTVTRADVGESDNAANEASRHKSAYSDALKRAAVQFGVGRYLYDLPKMWADYDANKRTWAPAGLKKLQDTYSRAIQVKEQPQQVAPPIPAGISTDAAKRLHAALGAVLVGTQYATMEHNQFASSVVGRNVASLTELSTAEAKSVHGAAKVAEQEAA